MRRHRFRPHREDPDPEEHATAMPIRDDEQAKDRLGRWSGGAMKHVPRPDADCFAMPADGEDEPPIAAMFDQYEDEDAS